MRWILITGLWVGTVTAAFLLGRSTTLAPPPEATLIGEETAEILRRRVGALSRELEEYRGSAKRGGAGGGESGAGAPGGSSPGQGESLASSFTLEGISTPHDLSSRLMKFVDTQLARGPEGYLAILDMLKVLEEGADDLERLLADEGVVIREIYPWLRFLVQREREMVDMTEFVFRTMARNPSVFGGMDKDSLEIFTEGLGALLPGAIPEKRLVEFRKYAREILETPEERQPEAVRRNRKDVQALLERHWTEPLTPEQALEKIQSGNVSPHEIARLLASLPPELLAKVDVPGILGPLVATERYEALRILRFLPPGTVDPSILDGHLLQGMQSGKVSQRYYVRNYLEATGRDEWRKIRPLIDAALAQGEKSRETAALTLRSIPEDHRPDRAYVEDLIQRYELSDQVEQILKRAYGID